jgi:hypothetical protein
MLAGPEFAPEIFSVSSEKLFAISASLVTPALGFLFLYLLRLPLTKLPGIEAPAEWKPPRWALPLFALVSTAAVVFTVVLGLALEFIPDTPPSDEVSAHFGLIREVRVADIDTIKSVVVSISDYDGESDLRIIANGYIQFSTSTNCMMSYQCKPANAEVPPETKQVFEGPALKYVSLFRVKQRYVLPVNLDVTNFFVPGTNFLDIISGNSGVGDCRVSVSISISDISGVKKNVEISISDDEGQHVDLRADARHQETFFSAYRAQGSTFEPTVHPVYRTLEANPSYRLCQRIRMIVPISTGQLSWRTEEAWTRWAQERRRREECEVRNGTDSVCSK